MQWNVVSKILALKEKAKVIEMNIHSMDKLHDTDNGKRQSDWPLVEKG